MARVWLVFYGLVSIVIGILSYALTDTFADLLGVTFQGDGGRIEFLSHYAGAWPALGIFAILGSAILRLRVSAVLAVLVTAVGTFGGVMLGMTRGLEPSFGAYLTLGFNAAIALTAIGAYFSARAEVRELQVRQQQQLEEKLRNEAARHAAAAAKAASSGALSTSSAAPASSPAASKTKTTH